MVSQLSQTASVWGLYRYFVIRLLKQNSPIITIIALTISILKTVYKHVKLYKINVLNIAKLVMISAYYHDSTQSLLVMIIIISKNHTIIGKNNIMINRQN